MGALADDVLHGASEIAFYVFKKKDRRHLRKVYHKHETGQWPIWKDGLELTSRRSLLDQHFNPPPKMEAAE
jgi:hypothetical protein